MKKRIKASAKTSKIKKRNVPKPKKKSKTPTKTSQVKKKSNVSAAKKRIKIGITNLDPLIQGGLKEKSISVVAGDTGSGKTIFALQFLHAGLINGENCLYLTFEEKRDKLYDDMLPFHWDFAKYEEKKQLFFLEYSPEQVRSLIEEGGGTVDQLISKHKITRIVIDSITSFSLLYQDELAKKESGLALFELINKWGCTAVLTAQAESRDSELINASLEFEADNIILLYHFKNKGRRRRAIEILKMRGTNHTDKTMEIIITSKGLVVRPSTIIK